MEKLFRNVANIFKKYLSGPDDEALAKTAKLGERFGAGSSLSGLDFSVDVEQSVTFLAAHIVSEVDSVPAPPIDRLSQIPVTTSQGATPGGEPSAAAAIPQPPTGTSASTPSLTAAPVVALTDVTRLSVPAQETQKPTSLIQQVLNALKDAKVDSHKVRKYLPDFFERLREDLGKELRGERAHRSGDQDQPVTQAQTPGITSTSVVFAYQSVSQTTFSLSIHS